MLKCHHSPEPRAVGVPTLLIHLVWLFWGLAVQLGMAWSWRKREVHGDAQSDWFVPSKECVPMQHQNSVRSSGKSRYRSEEFDRKLARELRSKVRGYERVIVGIDIAKETQFAAIVLPEDRELVAVVSFESPAQDEALLSLLAHLGPVVEVVIESTGRYSEPIRRGCYRHGLALFQVGTKRVSDACELYDGVPSLHDRKAAWVLCRLHLEGISQPWVEESLDLRRLRALMGCARRYDQEYTRRIGQLEAMLAQWWPGLTENLGLTSATLLGLLTEFGSPAAVASEPQRARELMRSIGGHNLSQAKIEGVIALAKASRVEMLSEEVEAMREHAAETNRKRRLAHQARKRLEKRAEELDASACIRDVAGAYTSAVLAVLVGDPRQFHSAASYLKALGLNLGVYSSGKSKRGQLRISKRGASYPRRLLYMMALRYIANDPVVRAWYQSYLDRNGGIRLKGVVAVMRKLARALWAIAQTGEEFDATKLFDTTRLSITDA